MKNGKNPHQPAARDAAPTPLQALVSGVCEEQRWTRGAVAAKSGMASAALSRLCAGRQPASREALAALAGALGLRPPAVLRAYCATYDVDVEDVPSRAAPATPLRDLVLRQRRAKGFSTRELLAKAELSRDHLAKLCAGRKRGSPEALARLAAALGVEVQEVEEAHRATAALAPPPCSRLVPVFFTEADLAAVEKAAARAGLPASRWLRRLAVRAARRAPAPA